jgi:hypothetical protein
LGLGTGFLSPATAGRPGREVVGDGKKDRRDVKDICCYGKDIFHPEGAMSFREKAAWITLVSVLLCFGLYFGSIATGRITGRGWGSLHLLLLCVAVFVVLQIGLNLAARWTTPRDGRTPRDEREMLIQARSHTLGYHVLMVLVLGLGVPMHLAHADAVALMNFALLDVVVAGLVVAVAQVVMFRRGF